MGVIPQDARVQSDVDSFIEYAKMQGGNRVYVVLGRDRTLTLRPKVQSRMDCLYLQNVSKEILDKIVGALRPDEVRIFTGEGWSPADDRLPGLGAATE